jgi:hypothetical protein
MMGLQESWTGALMKVAAMRTNIAAIDKRADHV